MTLGQKLRRHVGQIRDKYRKGKDFVIPYMYVPKPSLQTNLSEVQPERMRKLMDRFKLPDLRDTEGMYVHAALDKMIETQGWVCPIQADKRVDGAYYSPGHDIVVVPMKAQFNIGSTPDEIYRGGMEFYSTMLHEMAHSTMTPERLNRDGTGRFGDPKYAKEELVSELTAAMISYSMGFIENSCQVWRYHYKFSIFPLRKPSPLLIPCRLSRHTVSLKRNPLLM